MYSYISGNAVEVGEDYCVIDNGGIGYMLYCGAITLKDVTIGKNVKLYVHDGVSDDNFMLYGFKSSAERTCFRRLISITGVGKKLALSILSSMTADDITEAVAMDNAAAFYGVSGVGKKTAARIVLEMKSKITALDMALSSNTSADDGKQSIKSEAIEALIALGYDGMNAGKAVSAVPESDYTTVEGLIKQALVKATSN